MKHIKIAHIVTDEKFINSVQWQFDQVCPRENTFFVFVDNHDLDFKHIKFKDNIVKIKRKIEEIDLINIRLSEFDLVILHSISYFHSLLVNRAKNTDKFVWFFWGGEFYNNPEVSFKFSMIGEKTRKKLLGRNKMISFLSDSKNKLNNLFDSKKSTWNSISKAAKKINKIGILHYEDVEMLKNYNYVKIDVEHIEFTYYPIEFTFKNNQDIELGNNILVGNSATPTNNHFEVFELLSKFSLEERKIITPLSYGNKVYAEKVKRLGDNMFKDNFFPITEFMTLEKYNKVIQQCGVVIINTYRQQAVGNILSMLWMGAKIYLDNKNTFYKYLKRKGFFIYSINDDFKIENFKVLVSLTKEEKTHNKQILKREISTERLFSILKKTLIK